MTVTTTTLPGSVQRFDCRTDGIPGQTFVRRGGWKRSEGRLSSDTSRSESVSPWPLMVEGHGPLSHARPFYDETVTA